MIEVRRARQWQATRGVIVSSRVAARTEETPRHPGQQGRQKRTVNYPDVRYRYTVAGHDYFGTRITILEAVPDDEIEETVGRYPPGADVEVFYDPAHPQRAVLERELPEGMARGIGCLFFAIAGAAATVLFVSGSLSDLIAPHLPSPEGAPSAVAFGGGGLIFLVMAVALQRQVAAAKRWPSTKGRIASARLETFRGRTTAGLQRAGGAKMIMYQPRVVYRYEVGGRSYKGDRVAFGAIDASSLPAIFRKRLDRYARGSDVDVFYDPAAPSQSVLERRGIGLAFLWIMTAALWVAAAFEAGFIG